MGASLNAKTYATIRAMETLRYGEFVIYHIGMLANDKAHDKDVLRIAMVAQDLVNTERVVLTQRKIGDMRYQYIATGIR